MSSSRSLARK